MTIRKRLGFSFLAILLLFGGNLAVYFWGTAQRDAAFEELRRSGERQLLLARFRQDVGNLRQQVVITTTAADPNTPIHPATLKDVDASIDALRIRVSELARSAGAIKGEQFQQLSKLAGDLLDSWKIFVHNFGLDTETAILQQIKAEKLATEVIDVRVGKLEEDERRRGDAARRNFEQVAAVTGRMTVAIFVFSILLAVSLAIWVSRRLIQGLGDLKIGALEIGGGGLDHRIEIRTNDEFGELARCFNEMAVNLSRARDEIHEAKNEIEAKARETERQKGVADELLRNILPAQIADELRSRGEVDPKYFEDTTVIFTDFVGFTRSTEQMAAEELVSMLHDYFTAFDRIVRRYGLEKLKTIGDSYMCAAGIPDRKPSHAVDAVLAAFEMARAVEERKLVAGSPAWEVRIGIHTGPVVAGVVGIDKFAFDVWGETVNFASRMESSCIPGHVNISERTWSRVKDFIDCERRGLVQTKDKKEAEMFFARGILPTLAGDGQQSPPEPFRRRYRVYFQKDLPSFPSFLVRPATGVEVAAG